MNFNKNLGYLLLIAGLLLIGFTILYSYNIFTGKSFPPKLFKELSSRPSQNSEGGSLSLENKIEDAVSKQIRQIIPADAITQVLNLLSWSILAGILIFGGGQIGSLGIKMIK